MGILERRRICCAEWENGRALSVEKVLRDDRSCLPVVARVRTKCKRDEDQLALQMSLGFCVTTIALVTWPRMIEMRVLIRTWHNFHHFRKHGCLRCVIARSLNCVISSARPENSCSMCRVESAVYSKLRCLSTDSIHIMCDTLDTDDRAPGFALEALNSD